MSQDAKAHDGQQSAGAVTVEQGPPVMSAVHDATDVAAEDDVAQDEDGKSSNWVENLAVEYALYFFRYAW